MSSSTSIGRGPAHGSNENHDGDPTHKTLGEGASQEAAPAGSGAAVDEARMQDDAPAEGTDVLDAAAPDMPAGVPGGRAHPGIAKGPQSYPDGPNVENSPWELEAARGHLPQKDR